MTEEQKFIGLTSDIFSTEEAKRYIEIIELLCYQCEGYPDEIHEMWYSDYTTEENFLDFTDDGFGEETALYEIRCEFEGNIFYDESNNNQVVKELCITEDEYVSVKYLTDDNAVWKAYPLYGINERLCGAYVTAVFKNGVQILISASGWTCSESCTEEGKES